MARRTGQSGVGRNSQGATAGRGVHVMLALLLCSVRATLGDYQDTPRQSDRPLTPRHSREQTAPAVDSSYQHGGSSHSRGPQRPGPTRPGSLGQHDSSGLSVPSSRRPADTDVQNKEQSVPVHCPQTVRTNNRTKLRTLQEVDGLLCQYYGPWSKWRRCSKTCQQTRVRRCRVAEQCGVTTLKEHRPCRRRRRPCSAVSQKATSTFRGQNRMIERVLYDVLYTDWSDWGSCTRSCKQRRRRRCTVREVCQKNFVQETRRCSARGSRCEKRFRVTGNEPSPTKRTPKKDTHVTTPRKTKPRTQKKKLDKEDVLAAAQKNCGIRPAATRGSYRVVGGQEAQRLSWPWQMTILNRWDVQYCAGTLIAPQWVLTAAHCVRKNNRRRRIIVRAGEHNLEEFEGSEVDILPEREYPHPDFDYETILNDIALVRLAEPIKARAQSGYACLPEPGFSPDPNSLCYILGWGKRRNTFLYGADQLFEAQVPLVSHKRCQKVFDYHINKTQICAGFKRGGTDSCAGDSGGPLLCPKTTGGVTRWFLLGITSYGEGCGRKGKYGIYTRVTRFRDWVSDIVQSY